MTGRTRAWMVLLASAGMIASVSAAYMHFQLVANPAYTSFCDVNETVSCTQLYQSRYGSVAGIPVALGGVLWFGVVLLLAYADARGLSRSRENVATYLAGWSTVGLSVTAYLAYASVFLLGMFCILCGIVYVTTLGIFLLTPSEKGIPLRSLPSAFAHDIRELFRHPVGLAVTLVFVLGTLSGAAWFREPPPSTSLAALVPADEPASASDQRSEFERYWESQPRVDSGVDAGDAVVVVVKFNDYQCPACAQTHRVYEPIFAKYESSHPGKVRLVMRDFPLDPRCNDGSPNGPHGSACEAAVAARLAREVGVEEARRMDEWLYSNQEAMTPETVAAALADVVGIDAGQLEVRYDEVVEQVKADIADGAMIPVEATPTYIVNGVLIKGGLEAPFFDQAIAYELARANAAP